MALGFRRRRRPSIETREDGCASTAERSRPSLRPAPRAAAATSRPPSLTPRRLHPALAPASQRSGIGTTCSPSPSSARNEPACCRDTGRHADDRGVAETKDRAPHAGDGHDPATGPDPSTARRDRQDPLRVRGESGWSHLEDPGWGGGRIPAAMGPERADRSPALRTAEVLGPVRRVQARTGFVTNASCRRVPDAASVPEGWDGVLRTGLVGTRHTLVVAIFGSLWACDRATRASRSRLWDDGVASAPQGLGNSSGALTKPTDRFTISG